MNLNHINIKNFRCFEEIDFDFGTTSTVFIGENGSGKSSIISATYSNHSKCGNNFFSATNGIPKVFSE